MNSVIFTHLANQQKTRRQMSSFFILKDPLEKLERVSKFRVSVRMLLTNEKGEIAYLHLKGHDEYGLRDHYESIGGGIKEQEEVKESLERELLEESGYVLEDAAYLFSVVDEYARFHQVNLHHYYWVQAKGKEKPLFTEFEKRFKIQVIFQSPERWLEVLSKPAFGVNALVHQREYRMLAYLLGQSESSPELLADHKKASGKEYQLDLKSPQWLDILLRRHHALDRLRYLSLSLSADKSFLNYESSNLLG